MADAPLITVVAGPNGAGKSSVQGAMLRAAGADPFDPDEAAREIGAAAPGLSVARANEIAWREGVRLLARAIDEHLDFTFETTLGGRTIASMLERAAGESIEVWIWYVGLDSPERSVARVAARVARGGHAIPEELIRRRYRAGIENLVRLLPRLTALRVYDNGVEADPHDAVEPRPALVLHMERGAIIETCDLARAPAWAKAILELALQASD